MTSRSRPATLGALWATAAAAFALAGALSLPYWGPPLGLEPTGANDAALSARLATLESRVQSLAGRSDTGGLAAKQGQLADRQVKDEQRLAAMERSVAELAARPAADDGADAGKLAALAAQASALKGENATLSQQVMALGQQVAKLEAQAQRNQAAESQRAALILAVGQLGQALTRSTAYDQPLAAVAALAKGDSEMAPALAALKPRAATGVPTADELASRFDAVSVAAARAAIVPEQPGWIGKALTRLSRLVIVRRTDGGGASEGPDAVLARAERLVHKGDLAAAVATLAALRDGPAKAVQPWLADARARLAADDALKTLAARAIARLGEAHS